MKGGRQNATSARLADRRPVHASSNTKSSIDRSTRTVPPASFTAGRARGGGRCGARWVEEWERRAVLDLGGGWAGRMGGATGADGVVASNGSSFARVFIASVFGHCCVSK